MTDTRPSVNDCQTDLAENEKRGALRGVVVFQHPRRVLFSKTMTLKTALLPRWQTQTDPPDRMDVKHNYA